MTEGERVGWMWLCGDRCNCFQAFVGVVVPVAGTPSAYGTAELLWESDFHTEEEPGVLDAVAQELAEACVKYGARNTWA